MERPSSIKEAIRTVAARFDIFDYPLTDFEIWQFLPLETSYADVRTELKAGPLERADGFFFLPGRRSIVAIRHQRYRDAEMKIRRARRRLRLFSWLPWIRLLALANVIGPHNLKAKSDIDLFILTQKNRVWLVKFFASSVLALLGLRPTRAISKDRLCVSFLADESARDLSGCRLGENDWYFSYWLAGLVPLWAEPRAYDGLIKANPWLASQLPNWQPAVSSRYRLHDRRPKKASSSIFNPLEKISRRLQEIIMATPLREQKNRGSGVIITDHLLKLHTGDRRPELFAEAEKRYAKI